MKNPQIPEFFGGPKNGEIFSGLAMGGWPAFVDAWGGQYALEGEAAPVMTGGAPSGPIIYFYRWHPNR